MNRYLPLAILSLAILSFATLLLVVFPGVQIAARKAPPGLHPYTAQELRGRAVYISLGCLYCHSQQPRSADQAPDAERGWGRAAVSADYVYDNPHQLGTMRTGPDLMNIGARMPSQPWHLTHLYNPRAIFAWSIMPSYPFLFAVKKTAAPGDVTVQLPAAFQPRDGVVVATQQALDLVAYLKAMDRTYPVPADSLRDNGYLDAATAPKATTTEGATQ